MDPSLGLARARPKIVHIWRARDQIWVKGLGPGTARDQCQSLGALERLFMFIVSSFLEISSHFVHVSQGRSILSIPIEIG